jgi:hypothetical protein
MIRIVSNSGRDKAAKQDNSSAHTSHTMMKAPFRADVEACVLEDRQCMSEVFRLDLVREGVLTPPG